MWKMDALCTSSGQSGIKNCDQRSSRLSSGRQLDGVVAAATAQCTDYSHQSSCLCTYSLSEPTDNVREVKLQKIQSRSVTVFVVRAPVHRKKWTSAGRCVRPRTLPSLPVGKTKGFKSLNTVKTTLCHIPSGTDEQDCIILTVSVCSPSV